LPKAFWNRTDRIEAMSDAPADTSTQPAAVDPNPPAPKPAANVSVNLAGIRPPRCESTAWDLAVATGTLAYIDSELAFALSRTYALQTTANQLGKGMMDAMYLRTPTLDGDAFLAALKLYYDDLTEIEPNLIPVYDTLLEALDEALAE
jgi:hypothetical protein